MGLLLGLLALVGSALFAIGLFVLKVLAVAALITGVVTWFNWLYEKHKVIPGKGNSFPVRTVRSLLNDAKRNAEPKMRKKYDALEKTLLAGCDNKDILGLAQNSNGDIIAATSFSAEDYTHQDDDARDYSIAVDRNGRVIKKIKIA